MCKVITKETKYYWLCYLLITPSWCISNLKLFRTEQNDDWVGKKNIKKSRPFHNKYTYETQDDEINKCLNLILLRCHSLIISHQKRQATKWKESNERDGEKVYFAPIINKTHKTQACTLIRMHKRWRHIYFSGEVSLI